MTYKEISGILERLDSEEFDLFPLEMWLDQEPINEDYLDDSDDNYEEAKSLLEQLGEYDIAFSNMSEVNDAEVSVVYHFKDHDIYIEFFGKFVEGYGNELTDYHQVVPREVTSTEFEKL